MSCPRKSSRLCPLCKRTLWLLLLRAGGGSSRKNILSGKLLRLTPDKCRSWVNLGGFIFRAHLELTLNFTERHDQPIHLQIHIFCL